MNDEQMYRVLTDFANEHTLAKDMVISVTSGGLRRMIAKDGSFAKIEDVNLLRDLILGAEHFLLWSRRKGLIRFKSVPKRNQLRNKSKHEGGG